MTMQIGKAGVDLGIVVRDLDAMLAFYRDTLGLYHEGQNPVPGGGVMHRLWAAETWSSSSHPPRPRCCLSAKRVPAKKSSPGRCTS